MHCQGNDTWKDGFKVKFDGEEYHEIVMENTLQKDDSIWM